MNKLKLKEVKKKDDLMQKVREQTALLKKKKHEKEYEDKIHKGLNESAAAYEREISKLEEQVSGVKKKIMKPIHFCSLCALCWNSRC